MYTARAHYLKLYNHLKAFVRKIFLSTKIWEYIINLKKYIRRKNLTNVKICYINRWKATYCRKQQRLRYAII